MNLDRVAIWVTAFPFVEDREIAPRVLLRGLGRFGKLDVPEEKLRQNMIELQRQTLAEPAGCEAVSSLLLLGERGGVGPPVVRGIARGVAR